MNLLRRKSLFSSEVEPASLNLTTVMYPPRRIETPITSKAQLHRVIFAIICDLLATSNNYEYFQTVSKYLEIKF